MPEDELAARRRLRSGQELRERLRAARAGAAGRGTEGIDLDPHSAYELLTRQMVGDLAEQLREFPSYTNKIRPGTGWKPPAKAVAYQLLYGRTSSIPGLSIGIRARTAFLAPLACRCTPVCTKFSLYSPPIFRL